MTGHLGYESTGPERAPRPEQRPGAERLGREPVYLPGYQPVDDPEIRRKFSERVGRRGSRAPRLPARPDRLRPPRRPHQGAVPHRREPGADRAERAPRRGGAREARLPDVAGHLPERLDAEVRGRRPPRVELRREGRHVHEHRAADQPRARGRAAARRDAKVDREIVILMAKALGADWPEYPDAESVWNELADLAPNWYGIRYDRIEENGMQWPCPISTIPERRTCTRRRRLAAGGRGKFFPVEYQPPIEEPDSEYPFVLTTGRTLYHYNSANMTMREPGVTDKQQAPFFEISRGRRRRARDRRRRGRAARLAPRRARGGGALLGARLPGPRLDGAPLRRAEGELAHARRRRSAHRDARVQGQRRARRSGGVTTRRLNR